MAGKKWIYWMLGLLIGALVILFAVSVVVKEQSKKAAESFKEIEVHGSTIAGFQKGKKSWEVRVGYQWTGQSKYLIWGENVFDGRLFDSAGKLVVSDLKAREVRVNSRSKILNAFGAISATFLRRQPKAEEWVKISCEELRYSDPTKTSYLAKNIMIIKGKYVIRPLGEVEVNHDQNIAYVRGGFLMDSDRYWVSGNAMTIFIDEDYADIIGPILMMRKGETTPDPELDPREIQMRSKNAYIMADFMTYRMKKDDNRLEVRRGVHLIQDDKEMWGEQGYYSEKDDLFYIQGNVRMMSGSLGWLINRNRKPKIKNEEFAKSMEEPLEFSCQSVLFNSKTRNIELYGDVKIHQPEKWVSCQRVFYDDQRQSLLLAGNVVVKRMGEETFRTRSLAIDIDKETVEASHAFETEFKIKRKEKK